MSWKSISAATPSVASSQSMAFTAVACMARLGARPWPRCRASRHEAIMLAAHPHDPTTTRVSPM